MASRQIAQPGKRRPALGLILVFMVVLLSPILFDAVAPVFAR